MSISSPHILVVEKGDSEQDWVLHRLGELGMGKVLHHGPFVETWEHAQEIAAFARPSQIVALNAEGSIVVQELFPRLG